MTQTPENPRMISARRTESLDAPNISSLITSSTETLFGRTNIVNLIERALLAITLNNEVDEVLAHAAFLDYPNINTVEPATWFEWFSTYYVAGHCTPLNSVFLHYFVAKPDYAQGCARELIRTMFNAVPDVHYCLLAVPVGVELDESLSDLFALYPVLSELIQPPGQVQLFVAYRSDHVPVLHIREARVEDNDDLVPIFSRQSAMLSKTYGEYFLAELIEAQDENMQCLVAEINGSAVGFMSLCSDINMDLLSTCFELGPFHGLRVPDSSDIVDSQQSVSAGDDEGFSARKDSDSVEENAIFTDDVVGDSEINVTADLNATSLGDSTSEPLLKRKLSEDQRPGSAISDTTINNSAMNDALSRKLSQDSQQRESRLKLFAAPPELGKQIEKFTPVYNGPSSAFSIQLFCIDERYETRSCDFLPKAFSCFPDREYCIITVPHLVPEFPLLQHFIRVTPRATSTLAQELYVFGSNGLSNQFNVRMCAGADDLPGVAKLVRTLALGKEVLNDVQQFIKSYRDDDGTELQVFVAEVNQQTVGVAVVRREEDIEYIRSHYNIEDFIYFNHHRREEHGHLHHYALNPVFKHFSKIFLKEILRLGNKTSLYYPLFPAYTSKEKLAKHSLVAALNDMVPVRARRQIVYPVEKLGINAPSRRVLDHKEQFALNHINRKLVLEPKVTLNVRIVVVGASDVGMALLETFAFSPHLRFNNLTLISPHGMPGELPPNEIRDGLMSTSNAHSTYMQRLDQHWKKIDRRRPEPSHCYSQDEYDQMALRSWVNVVCGKMTAIDRRKKYVVVNGSFLVPYDHLVLCTGTQYQLPRPTGLDIANGATNNDIPTPHLPQQRFEGRPPVNAFTVNDSYDAAVVLYWIENNVFDKEGKVIVYGTGLDVYCCVQTLLRVGLSGSRIVIVEPPTDSQVTCFNNADVEKAVLDALANEGVEINSGYILSAWNDGSENVTEITSASFTSFDQPLRLECIAFFSYYAKMVDFEAFTAMNCACLVYDGRLVIDTNFHTNDASIRAAGPLTKYQRIYHTPLTHADFNSKEIGIQLAAALLSLFDPTVDPVKDQQDAEIRLIPTYRSPKLYGALLPGDYHYLHIEKPVTGRIPLSAQENTPEYGHEFITGKPGGNPEYFRLHINRYNSVETVTCLSKTPFATSNLLTLYGLHQRYLNNLVARFREGLISDFYSYFSESWAMAIFHDRFAEFREDIRDLLVSRPSDSEESLEEIIRRLMDDDTLLTEGHKALLRDRFATSGTKRAVETRLLNYINYNYYHLPMYAKPGMV